MAIHSTLAAAIVALAIAPASAEPLTPTEQEQTSRIAAGLALVSASERGIWPGYRPTAFPIVVHTPGRHAFLFNGKGDLPAGFERLPEPAGVAVGTGQRFPRAVDTEATLGGATGVTVEFMKEGLAETFETAVHEGFHHYQHQHHFFVRRTTGVKHADTAEDRALAEIEQRLLSDALESEDAGVARREAWRFLAVRQARDAKQPASARDYQDQLEAMEGTARYVEERAQMVAAALPAATGDRYAFFAEARVGLHARLARELRQDLSESAYGRGRFYGTGAAIGYLLDRFAPGWHRQAESGARLSALLAEATAYPGPKLGLFRQVADWFNPAASAARIEAFAAQERERRARFALAFRQSAGMRVTFIFTGGGYSFDARESPIALPDGSELYLPGTTISVEEPGRSAEITGLTKLSAGGTEGAALTFHERPEAITLRVGGQARDLSPGHVEGEIAFEGERGRLHGAQASLDIGPDEIRIRL